MLAGLVVVGAQPCHAYAPQAAAAIATLAPGVLPPAARWEAVWRDAAAAEVDLRMEAELTIDTEEFMAESLASLHRFLPDDSIHPSSTPGEVAGRTFVGGTAHAELAAAAAELRAAFALVSPVRIIRAVARIAVSATDLADPFMTSPPGLDECPGARARFSDLIGGADLDGLVPASVTLSSDVTGAGTQIAVESAGRRDAIESAMRRGDLSGLSALRRERLNSALALARHVVLAEWRAAGSPVLEDHVFVNGVARVLPNPTRGSAKLWFSLPRAGRARFELYDIAGRCVLSADLGRRAPGPQEFVLDPTRMNALHPGLYFSRISTEAYRAVGRLVLVRD